MNLNTAIEEPRYFVQVGCVDKLELGHEEEADKKWRESECRKAIQLALEKYRCVGKPRIIIAGNVNIVGVEPEAVE